MLIRALIFDFDGTLAPQTNLLHYSSFRDALKKFGFTLTKGQYAPYLGVPQEQIVDVLLPHASAEIKKKINLYKTHYYLRLIAREKLPATNVHTLERLKERGFKIAISSGSKRAPIMKLLPEHLVEHLVTAEGTHRPKPDPEILLKAARDIRVRPEQCAYVGDSWRDCEAARRAEMLFVGVLSDITAEELVKHGPDILINKIPELLKLFTGAPQEIVL